MICFVGRGSRLSLKLSMVFDFGLCQLYLFVSDILVYATESHILVYTTEKFCS